MVAATFAFRSRTRAASAPVLMSMNWADKEERTIALRVRFSYFKNLFYEKNYLS